MSAYRHGSGEGAPKRYSAHDRSPTSSVIPDSQSPEPHTVRTDTQLISRDYATETTLRALYPPAPPSVDGSIVADSFAGIGEAPPRPRIKPEEEEDNLERARTVRPTKPEDEPASTYSTASASSTSSAPTDRSRLTRARSPSAPDVRTRAVKDEADVKEEELTDELRRQLWGSRVNEVRRRPDRRRDRAPSHETPVKGEEREEELGEAIWAEAAGLGRGGLIEEVDEQEEEGPMLPPARPRPSAVALGKRVAGDYSSSSEDDGDEVEEQDETDELETASEGTPFEERPPKRKKVVKHVKKRAPKPKKLTQKEKQKQLDGEATNFLDSLELPAPIYRPVAIKARLINQFADTTATLPTQARIDRVEVPVRLPSPSPPPIPEPTPLRSPTPPAPRIRPGSGPSLARPASAADSLPDYDDDADAPEQPAVAPVDAELLEEQAYFRCPTKVGAMERWVVMLAKDKRRLPEVFDYDVFAEDRAFLRSANLPVPPASNDFILARDFQSSRFRPLVQSAPSGETCAELWSDLLAPAHPTAHHRADAAAARGHACCCPVWAPPGPREWAVERARLAREEGLGVRELVEVAREVFDLDAQRIARDVRERPGMADELVEIVYEHNWLWYSQVLELARIARCSRALASPWLVAALEEHVARSKRRYETQHALAVAARAEDERRARHEGRIPRVELLQEVKLMETKHARDEAALTAFLARLKALLAAHPEPDKPQEMEKEGEEPPFEQQHGDAAKYGGGGSMQDWLLRESR
ncbi:hypothetical protein JCM10450v2_000226 [Rhodotorula kratochvilovae]